MCTGSTISQWDSSTRHRVRAPAQSPTGWCRRSSSNPSPPSARCWRTRERSFPTTGRGSIVYVIAAYNNGDFQTMKVGGVDRQVFGFEWGYQGTCPVTQKCGPIASGIVHFNAAACFAIRTDQTQSPTYSLRCLSGTTLTPSATVSKPIRSGQAFVSIRSILPSPFADGRIYYAGYDCNFYPANGTAWVASSTLSSLRLLASSKGRPS